MSADSFFARWSRRKAEASGQTASRPEAGPPAPALPDPAAAPDEAPPLTLADAARLTPQSDFSAFIARGVDKAVRRNALKTLFSDPHFNVMDGLDIYIDDYNRFEPMPADMLEKLSHAQSVLNPVPLGRQAQPAAAADEAAAEPDSCASPAPPSDAPEAADATETAGAQAVGPVISDAAPGPAQPPDAPAADAPRIEAG